MNQAIIVAIIGVIGVATTGLIGYFVAKRTTSGTISTTQADTLWAQNEKLLDRYERTAIEAVAKVATQAIEIAHLEAELKGMREERDELQRQYDILLNRQPKPKRQAGGETR